MSDFSSEQGSEILRNLKTKPGYYNHGKRTVGDFLGDSQRNGAGATVRDRLDWGSMRMDPTDLADVTGYTFLVNGKSARENWTRTPISASSRFRSRSVKGRTRRSVPAGRRSETA